VDTDWIQYVTEAGRTFYYNQKTGDFQWTNPKISNAGGDDHIFPWEQYLDEESGMMYWYNKETNTSQWEQPWMTTEELVAHADGDGLDAQQVTDENDLGI